LAAYALPGPAELTTSGAWAKDDELFRAFQHGDRRARDELVERFMPFVRKMALRYNYTNEPLDDLVQVACLGLLKAIERFDPNRGYRFASFAAPTILGELKRHFRDRGWGVHVPRDLQEQALAMGRARERLTQGLGHSPAVQELADALGWPLEQVLEAIDVVRSYETTSLDAPVARDDEDTAALVESLGCEEDGFDLAERREAIAQTWSELSELERRVVALRCMHDLTQREIGEEVGYSQMHVSRLLRRSVTRLVEPLAA
jgi:RNA polymerase sigma-B factor